MAKAFKEWFWEKPSGIRPWLRILPQEASGPGVPQPPVRAMPGSRPRACGLRITYLPHEVVVLADIHTLWGDDSAGEGAHLRACLDPRLGEDAEALTGDGTLCDDHLGRQHQAGQLLHLCSGGPRGTRSEPEAEEAWLLPSRAQAQSCPPDQHYLCPGVAPEKVIRVCLLGSSGGAGSGEGLESKRCFGAHF